MEFQIWLEDDPHAQSWRTICGDESVAIMERLGIVENGKIVDRAGFDNCLACHNTARRFDEPRRAEVTHEVASDDVNTFLREGVGCAGCHGPSEQWISTHFQRDWSPSGATNQGFVEAGDLFVRARMCASCHVGDQDRDMNHDIIAAGHPTLRYELATFHSWQPKHWRDHEASDPTYYEAQLWLAGQLASTDASLALLQTRAKKAHAVSTWPEFAAYNCASCHHNLALDNQRKPIDDNRKAVALYSQWDDAGIRWLIQFRIETGQATEEDDQLIVALEAVKQSMDSIPRPRADQVAQAAHQAREALSRWFDGAPGAEERLGFRSERLGRIVASAAGKPNTYRSWESAAQFYLAAVAARESWPGGWNGPVRGIADRMQHGLRYPEMIDISRVEKRRSGPTATRQEMMELGIQLAGWLGPVEAGIILDEDEQITDALRASLREMIERINLQRRQMVPNVQDPRQQDLGRPGATRPPAPEPGQPPATRQQLLEQLRQRREAREQNNPSREP